MHWSSAAASATHICCCAGCDAALSDLTTAWDTGIHLVSFKGGCITHCCMLPAGVLDANTHLLDEANFVLCKLMMIMQLLYAVV